MLDFDDQPYAGMTAIFKALKFASLKHKTQRRKDRASTPYINHPIDVAECLWNTAGIRDTVTICAALLHDTVEDTETSLEEIELLFGEEVRAIVAEVTDDKSLPKAERKRLQIVHAPTRSDRAKCVKLADKISNVRDMTISPPAWERQRLLEYLDWSEQVVAGLRGVNEELECLYDQVLSEARSSIE